ncbi:hypothetical protein DB459_15795 [Bradyrhizobium sp. WD16]|nr:hypothetical protein DB459_15795 [Bradyrhizobium sp. WD16]
MGLVDTGADRRGDGRGPRRGDRPAGASARRAHGRPGPCGGVRRCRGGGGVRPVAVRIPARHPDCRASHRNRRRDQRGLSHPAAARRALPQPGLFLCRGR